MNSFPSLTFVIAAAVLTTNVTAAERKVAMNDLPAAVQQAMRDHTKGLTIVGLAEETEDGKTLYEVETKKDGQTRDILFDTAGKVVEEEQEVTLASIPELARTALQRAAVGGEITKVEAITKNGVTLYEAEVKKKGKDSEVVVGADGTIQRH
jgi:uncharacterized membrane protein YkoI